jgi:hypothetical protein
MVSPFVHIEYELTEEEYLEECQYARVAVAFDWFLLTANNIKHLYHLVTPSP